VTAVVAVASPGSAEFTVINFSNTPPSVVMTPGFENGNIVDCCRTLAAVGENRGLSVTDRFSHGADRNFAANEHDQQ
jgi:hypothetical protein